MSKLEKIPKEIRAIPHWVAYKIKEKEKKTTKVPINPNSKTGKFANVSDIETWGTYEQAVKAFKNQELDGVGFVFTKNDPYVGIDIDDCRNPETKKIKPQAKKIIKELASYTEVSPSGTGIHIIVKAELPEGRRKCEHFEIYDCGRYFTVTGRHLKSTPKTIRQRIKAVKRLYKKYCSQDTMREVSTEGNCFTHISDEEVIQRAKIAKDGDKFKKLWKGDISGHKSKSEAELAICSILCFWVGRDSKRIDKLFRQSGLCRKKWDKKHSADGKTYGEMTIGKAMKGTKQFYNAKPDTLQEILKKVRCFHTPGKDTYLIIKRDDHNEIWPVRSTYVEHWLRHIHYKATSSSLKSAYLGEILDQLETLALFEGEKHELYTRIAEHKNKIFIDLCNERWEVVEISKKGWKIIQYPPVKFRRPYGMLSLPHPEKGGSLNKLNRFLNAGEFASKVMLFSWLIGSIRPVGPYCILLLLGEQGSAKSTLSRVLRALIDPYLGSLRTAPSNEQDLMITMHNSWVIAIDNLSYLRQWLSDGLCRLSTGGGLAVRKLYTDSGEIIFHGMRPIILNGIDVVAYGHDLIDRCIVVTLPRIEDKNRISEKIFWEKFEKARPQILGALYDAVSEALRNISNIKLKGHPRMADFAEWIVAAEPALPWKKGIFLKSYASNRGESVERSLGADPVAEAVRKMIDLKGKWRGSASELLEELEGHPGLSGGGFVSKNIIKSKVWPKAPNILSGRLKKASTFLSKVGIKVIFPKRTSQQRKIIIKKIKK